MPGLEGGWDGFDSQSDLADTGASDKIEHVNHGTMRGFSFALKIDGIIGVASKFGKQQIVEFGKRN